MNLAKISKEFDEFFEFTTDDKTSVSSVSCKLFADHCVIKAIEDFKAELVPVGVFNGNFKGAVNGKVEMSVIALQPKSQPESQPESTVDKSSTVQKPLSDEEIFKLCHYIDHDMLEEAFYRGARAIELAHGIGE